MGIRCKCVHRSNGVTIWRCVVFFVHKNKHPVKSRFSGMEVPKLAYNCGRHDLSIDKPIRVVLDSFFSDLLDSDSHDNPGDSTPTQLKSQIC